MAGPDALRRIRIEGGRFLGPHRRAYEFDNRRELAPERRSLYPALRETSDRELTNDRTKHGENAAPSGRYRGGAASRRGARRSVVAALGAVPERTAVGHRARGLQRARHRLGVSA